VFCVSEEDVAVLQKHVPAERVEWTGNGVDLSRFNPNRFTPGQKQEIREGLGIPARAFVVGIVARIVKEKGIRELLEAVAIARKTAPDIRLLLVGPVDTSRGDQVTPEVSEQYGVRDACHWTGERSDIPDLLAAMDVYCLPSYREGYPVSVIEAGAMGLPCIVTDVRGCREAAEDGFNGLLVPPRQVEPLAAAILRLHDDAELLSRMATNARVRAEAKFDERRVVEQILNVYHRLAPPAASAQVMENA
jgi:glycosyltransferase involved in cell wall biosynthesis